MTWWGKRTGVGVGDAVDAKCESVLSVPGLLNKKRRSSSTFSTCLHSERATPAKISPPFSYIKGVAVFIQWAPTAQLGTFIYSIGQGA